MISQSAESTAHYRALFLMGCCELVKVNLTIIIIQRIMHAFDCKCLWVTFKCKCLRYAFKCKCIKNCVEAFECAFKCSTFKCAFKCICNLLTTSNSMKIIILFS